MKRKAINKLPKEEPKSREPKVVYSEDADMDRMKEKFLIILDKHKGIIANACKQLELPLKTLNKWRKEDSDFDERIQLIKEVQLDYVEDALMKQIKQGNTQAILYYLRTQGKSRGWGDERSSKVDVGLSSKEFKLEFGDPLEEPKEETNE